MRLSARSLLLYGKYSSRQRSDNLEIWREPQLDSCLSHSWSWPDVSHEGVAVRGLADPSAQGPETDKHVLRW